MAFGPTRKGAGQRRHRAELQRATIVTDALKGRSETWSTYATVWAAKEETPQVVTDEKATVQFVVTMLYRDDVAVQERVLIDGKTLKILAVTNPDGIHRDSVLYCAEVKGG